MNSTKIMQSLKIIASELNNANIKWSLGASLMLQLRGIETSVDDIDIVIDESDYNKIVKVIKKYPHKSVESNPIYQTKQFYKLVINEIGIDIMIDFKVKTDKSTYIYPFHIEDTILLDAEPIHLASLSEWLKAYKAIGRKQKVALITNYLDFKITTDRLEITPVKYSDFDDIFEYLKLDEVHKFENSIAFTREKMHESINWLVTSRSFYSMKLQKTKKHIGHVYFALSNPPFFKEYIVGYIVNPLYQNKGYCSEAVKAIINDGFKTRGIHRVKAMCNPDNIASWKVMEKVGLIREGRLKKRVHFKDDEQGNPIWWDEFVYGIVKEDWK